MSAEPRIPPLIRLERWQHPVYGDRWTLSLGGRAIITRGTELEARSYARELGWRVERVADNDFA